MFVVAVLVDVCPHECEYGCPVQLKGPTFNLFNLTNNLEFDLGIVLGGRIGYQNISFEIGYDFGLIKHSGVTSSSFFVGVGFYL